MWPSKWTSHPTPNRITTGFDSPMVQYKHSTAFLSSLDAHKKTKKSRKINELRASQIYLLRKLLVCAEAGRKLESLRYNTTKGYLVGLIVCPLRDKSGVGVRNPSHKKRFLQGRQVLNNVHRL